MRLWEEQTPGQGGPFVRQDTARVCEIVAERGLSAEEHENVRQGWGVVRQGTATERKVP